MNLSDAVRAVAAVEGVWRVRLSSLEPQHVDDALLETILSEPKIAPYLYAPLQSGDDEILLAMKRGYTTGLYREIIEHTRRRLPNASINTDVIVGFPGETDQSFENTYRFCEEMGFTRMHIFPYSKRPHTQAARMGNHVHGTIVKERAARLQVLRLKLMGAFHQKWVGQTFSVLVEFVDPETGLHEGMTPEYIRVFFESSENLMGQIVNVRITRSRDEDVVGEIIKA
jgi:threonylcarbamoyladenosine tRNA methylthiotransferase MtaB